MSSLLPQGSALALRSPAERLLLWLPGIWLLLLVSLSLAPWIVKRRLGITGAYHNRGHFLAFFLTAIVFASGAKTARSMLYRAFGAALTTVVLEGLEAAVFGNHFEWRDVRFDLIGLAGGVVFLWFARKMSYFEH